MLNKLALKKTDYCASIGINDSTLLTKIFYSSSGLVMQHSYDNPQKGSAFLKKSRVVKSVDDLDEGAFDKVLCEYSEIPSVSCLLKVADHMGLVLVMNVPSNKTLSLTDYLESKGIFEWWILYGKSCSDVLFKNRKWAIP